MVFPQWSVLISVLSAPDCKGEDAEDTFTGLKVLKHSYGELLNKGLDLNSMKR